MSSYSILPPNPSKARRNPGSIPARFWNDRASPGHQAETCKELSRGGRMGTEGRRIRGGLTRDRSRLMTTNELVDLHSWHQSAVRHVRPDEDDPRRLMVQFWAYSPICYLTKDHPE